jgi:diguanylate cyclase (GGDEF)-like protein
MDEGAMSALTVRSSGLIRAAAAGRPAPSSGMLFGLVGATAAAAAVAVLGILGSPAAASVGAIFPGLIALASGTVLAVRGARMPAFVNYRRLFGAALILWSLGQLCNGVEVMVTTPVFPTPGDLISLLAAPLAVWGAGAVPRHSAGPHPGLRLGSDSLLLGVTLALPVWHFLFAGIFTTFHAGDLPSVIVLVADVTVVCVAVLAYVRDLDRALLVTSVGTACYTLGDLITMHSILEHTGHWPWSGAVLWCLAWPLIALGLLRYQPHAPTEVATAPVDPDALGVTITTTASLALLLVTLGGLVVAHSADRMSIILVIVAVVVIWTRELVNARFRAQLLRRLHDEATADPLTGLANRRVLAARMSTLPQGEPWCLLTVDLDGFKDVNDLLGHATGDRLLAAVAVRLKQAVPGTSLVSRIGGDEFAVLLPGDIEVGARVGAQIIAAVRKSAGDVEGVTRVEVSASVGVAAVNATRPQTRLIDLTAAARPADAPPVDGEVPGGEVATPVPVPTVVDPLGALSASGAALRRAKAGGRNRVELYDADAAQVRRRRLRVEERLRSAVETGAIYVLFQPIVDLRRGMVSGAEALARWVDPELGRVEPGEFITVAEQTGLVVEIGEHILEQTLRQAVDEGLFARGLRLTCNVSPVQLRVPGFDRVVQEAMKAHDVPRDQFVIEVTEQVLVEEGVAAQTLHRLNHLGVTIAIDDFGTGYSALGYLQRLPADILKIDRSLTSSLIAEPRSRAITRAVLDLGRTVGVSVVVEGVESSQVDDLIRRMGVGYGQGLYYGEAMTAPDLAAMADRLRGRPSAVPQPT